MSNKKNKTKKKNSSFELLGIVDKIGVNALQLNTKSESGYNYSRINVGVNCGEKHGTVYLDGMDGYSVNKETGDPIRTIYCHGKTNDGKDDFTERLEIDWADRKDEDILKDVGNMNFITVALEKETSDELIYNKFLCLYDAITYVKENLKEKMIIKVRGKITYNPYDKQANEKFEPTSIILQEKNKNNEPITKNDFYARFTQTVLLNKNSKGDYDDEKGAFNINGYVVEYIGKYKNVEYKNYFVMPKEFEYKISKDNDFRYLKLANKLFEVDEDITATTFEGEIITEGETIQATYEDLPDDIKEYVDDGILDLEEVLDSYATNGSTKRRMVIVKPTTRMIKNDDGTTRMVILSDKKAYKEEDLVDFFSIIQNENETEEQEKSIEKTVEKATNPEEDAEYLDMLKELGLDA